MDQARHEGGFNCDVLAASEVELPPDEPCAFYHRLKLAVRPLAREVLHSAVRRENETFGRQNLERPPNSRRHHRGRFDLRRAEIENSEDDDLARNIAEHVRREVRLCRFQRKMCRAALVELAKERIAGETFVDDVRIPEAGVQDGRAVNSLERTVDRLDGVFARRLRACLKVRLVDLDDVGSRCLEIVQLLVDCGRVCEGEAPLVVVVVVLGLLVIVNGPGTVILIRRSVIDRRNSTSRTSTGRVRRIGPVTRGTGFGCPVLSRATPGSSRSTPSSAVANLLE